METEEGNSLANAQRMSECLREIETYCRVEGKNTFVAEEIAHRRGFQPRLIAFLLHHSFITQDSPGTYHWTTTDVNSTMAQEVLRRYDENETIKYDADLNIKQRLYDLLVDFYIKTLKIEKFVFSVLIKQYSLKNVHAQAIRNLNLFEYMGRSLQVYAWKAPEPSLKMVEEILEEYENMKSKLAEKAKNKYKEKVTQTDIIEPIEIKPIVKNKKVSVSVALLKVFNCIKEFKENSIKNGMVSNLSEIVKKHKTHTYDFDYLIRKKILTRENTNTNSFIYYGGDNIVLTMALAKEALKFRHAKSSSKDYFNANPEAFELPTNFNVNWKARKEKKKALGNTKISNSDERVEKIYKGFVDVKKICDEVGGFKSFTSLEKESSLIFFDFQFLERSGVIKKHERGSKFNYTWNGKEPDMDLSYLALLHRNFRWNKSIDNSKKTDKDFLAYIPKKEAIKLQEIKEYTSPTETATDSIKEKESLKKIPGVVFHLDGSEDKENKEIFKLEPLGNLTNEQQNVITALDDIPYKERPAYTTDIKQIENIRNHPEFIKQKKVNPIKFPDIKKPFKYFKRKILGGLLYMNYNLKPTKDKPGKKGNNILFGLFYSYEEEIED